MTEVCRSLLRAVKTPGFSPQALNELFDGEKVSHLLGFDRNQFTQIRRETARKFSFSGVQDKIPLALEGNRLVSPGEGRGGYLLKPIPLIDGFQQLEDVPANEHLTMQIARQVFGIETAKNALLLFSDDKPVYLTRRFDISPATSNKLRQEDFCQLGERSEQTHGKNFKYDSSYEEAADLIRRYCSSAPVQLTRYFKLVTFCYLIGNGDAHLKNFSLIETSDGDFVLSEAYDLLATSLHSPHETRMALDLFVDHETEFFKVNGFYGRPDFIEFAKRIGVPDLLAVNFLSQIDGKISHVEEMIRHSFLSAEGKKKYLGIFKDRLLSMKPII